MLRKDYIMKMLQDLFDAIAKLLNDRSRSLTEVQKDVEALYAMLGSNADFFRTADIRDIKLQLADADGDYMARVEMLAEIMYADWRVFTGSAGQRREIAGKSLALYNYIEERSDSFSFQRLDRMDDLRNYLSDN